MNTNPKRTHFTVVEIAEQWGVSPNFVRREIWRGALRATRFGRTVRVSANEITRYVSTRTPEVA